MVLNNLSYIGIGFDSEEILNITALVRNGLAPRKKKKKAEVIVFSLMAIKDEAINLLNINLCLSILNVIGCICTTCSNIQEESYTGLPHLFTHGFTAGNNFDFALGSWLEKIHLKAGTKHWGICVNTCTFSG